MKNMDYLDPTKKKAKRRQLLVMYVLLGIAISIATVVFVYNVNGYSIDRKTGEVVQNGLLYIDTKPESAEITLNGQKQRGRTDARLVVEEGDYEIQLDREGYQPWKRSIVLEGGSLRRLTYARLIPQKIDTETSVTFDTKPTLLTQSIDKRWVVANFEGAPLVFRVFDTERPQAEVFNLQLPIDFLKTTEAGQWRVIDWADDHKTFLAKYETATTVEFALINREDATKARNITKQFATIVLSDVSLRSRKNDEIYIFSSATGILQRAKISDGSVEQVLTGVVDYKPYGDDGFVYLTSFGASENKIKAVLKSGSDEYVLRELDVSPNYVLDISKLGNAFVIGIGASSENRVIVYNDPINALSKNSSSKIPVPTTVLRITEPTELRISADSSVIMARNGNTVATHEFEADRSYNFSLSDTPTSKNEMNWIDGQHILYQTELGALRIVDFDGSNNFQLVEKSTLHLGAFNRSTEELFAITQPAEGSAQYLLTRHYLRSTSDR